MSQGRPVVKGNPGCRSLPHRRSCRVVAEMLISAEESVWRICAPTSSFRDRDML